MPLHRLVTPTYLGGLPGTHDLINDGTPDDAPADGAKSGGNNDGTYFVAFGEDATSSNANRPHKALAENTDFLDDILSGEIPMPATAELTASGAVTKVQLSDTVFVGIPGTYTDAAKWRDKLIKVYETSTGNELLDASGVPITVSAIFDATDSGNEIGNAFSGDTTGFHVNPYVYFSSAIPTTTNYTLSYGKKGTLKEAVVNKTFLDMTTRLLDGSTKVAGEVERFMHEASRRSGAIQALAATLIETPGKGDNTLAKADTITFDIDHDSLAGAGPRSLQVQIAGGDYFHIQESAKGADNIELGAYRSLVRMDIDPTGAAGSTRRFLAMDVGGSQFMEIGELTKGGNEVRMVGYKDDLSFEDARMDAANGRMALTTATDHEYLRVLENDFGSQPSLLEMINVGRSVVTCGDGTNSFGDFNGTSALLDALTYIASAGLNSFTILLKRGNYNLNVRNITTANGHISIIGVDRFGVNIRNSGSNYALGFTGTGNRVFFKNVEFEAASTGRYAIYTNTNNRMVFEDCIFNTQVVRWGVDRSLLGLSNSSDGTVHFRMTRCQLEAGNTVPALHFVFDDASAAPEVGTVLIEDCYFKAWEDNPLCRVEDHDIASPGYVEKILFNRCRVDLSTTDDNGGGNLTGNSGALELVGGSGGNFTIKDVEFRDCIVKANSDEETGKSNILLYVRTSDGVDAMNIGYFRIVGGTWYWPHITAEFNPIYIGGQHYGLLSTIGTVEIRNCKIGPEEGAVTAHLYGGPTTDVANGRATAATAAAFICAETVVVNNLEWIKAITGSGSGELEFYIRYNVNIDGIQLIDWSDTGTTARNFSVRIAAAQSGGLAGSVRHVQMDPDDPSTHDPINGYFELIPNSRLVLENCGVQNGMNTVSAPPGPAGFYLVPSTSGAAQSGLELHRCATTKCTHGFYYEPGAGDANLTNVYIKDCTFAFGYHGVRFRSRDGHYFTNIALEGTRCEFNTSRGFIFDPDAVDSTNLSTPYRLVDCSIKNNALGADNVQVEIGGNGGVYGLGLITEAPWYGVISGNDFGGNTTGFGQVKFYHPSSTGPFTCLIHGAQTEWPAATATWDFLNADIKTGGTFLNNRGRALIST